MISTLSNHFKAAANWADPNYRPLFGAMPKYLRYDENRLAWLWAEIPSPDDFPMIAMDVISVAPSIDNGWAKVSLSMVAFDIADADGYNYDVQAARALTVIVNTARYLAEKNGYLLLGDISFSPRYRIERFHGVGGGATMTMQTGYNCCDLKAIERDCLNNVI